MTEPASFQDAVFYEVLVPTFADGNADGIGDLTGLTSKAGVPAAAGGELPVAAAVLPVAVARRRL
jgi:hypothetical protein